MEGNLKIALLDPGPPAQEDVYGSRVDTVPTEHVVYAKRRDRGGGETLQADTLVGLWNTRFEIRRESRIESVDTSWSLRDERGRIYDIETINNAPGLRPSFLWVYAVSRS